jgi:purine-binding chemotaxis protein CheW
MNSITKDLKVTDYRESSSVEDTSQLVTFYIGKEELGFDISFVQEIISPIRITRVPNSSEFIKGVINLRGKIIPIFDLKERIKSQVMVIDENTKIIVVHKGELNIGLLVSKVNEVVLVSDKNLVAPSNKLNTQSDQYLKQIANLDNRLISIIDLERTVNLITEEID